MKKHCLYKLLLGTFLFVNTEMQHVQAQGIHFSQYSNAPLLLNPANAALMSESDYRVGINYRNQWNNIVPYKTMSAFADFQFLRNMNYSNWGGIGLAFFNDKAGNGDLSLTRIEGMIAYHVMTSDFAVISAGLSGAYGQRSLNYDKLTFNEQWVGRFLYGQPEPVMFDPLLPNGERITGTVKTSFFDVGAGANYSYFPNEFTYLKIGVGVAHIIRPKETFYKDTATIVSNKMGLRPTGNVDFLMRLNETFTINPSLYYTYQKKASELLFGSLGMIYVGGDKDWPTELILGAFYRWNEAAVGAFGLQYGGFRIMSSYDYTISTFSADNKGNGAFEVALSYQGYYGSLSRGRRTINCPRF